MIYAPGPPSGSGPLLAAAGIGTRSRRNRQSEAESTAFAKLGLDCDLAAVQDGQALGDVEPEASARDMCILGGYHATESREEFAPILLPDAEAIVLHDSNDPASPDGNFARYLAPRA
jgi:hypothetical protein